MTTRAHWNCRPTMPHSVSPEPSPSRDDEGGSLPDAPSETPIKPEMNDDDSLRTIDLAIPSGDVAVKQDVKLEDLFDDDEDDEFGSSSPAESSKMEVDSSPAEAAS